MTTALTRRAAIGALGLAAPAAVLAAQTAATAPGSVSPRLIALLQAYRAAVADRERYNEQVYWPALAARDADMDTVPPLAPTKQFTNVLGERHTFDAKGFALTRAQRIIAEGGGVGDTPDEAEYRAACQELVDQHDARTRCIEAIEARHRIDEIEAQATALDDPVLAAAQAMCDYPAASIEDVIEKLVALDEDNILPPDRGYNYVAELRALTGRARA